MKPFKDVAGAPWFSKIENHQITERQTKIFEQYVLLVVCRSLLHLIPIVEPVLFLFSRWDVVRHDVAFASIGWFTDTKQHSCLIYAGGVYTTCVIFLLFKNLPPSLMRTQQAVIFFFFFGGGCYTVLSKGLTE